MIDPTNDAKTWENYFKDIVRLHYKPANYRDIPDKHCGDFGIECFTLSGHVFQCYLPDQTADIDKLVKAQRNKINKDINKLTRKYISDLTKLFGDIKISRWILATSSSESAKLAQYCAQKSIAVRNLGLAYIASDFEILIHTENEYPVEVKQLKKEHYLMAVDIEVTDKESAIDWISDNMEFLAKFNLKIPKFIPEIAKHEAIKQHLIQKYLDYQNFMTVLESEWPDIHNVVYINAERREANLYERFILEPDMLPHDVIKNELIKLESDVCQEIKTFKPSDIDIIKWGVVSDWLIRCPLDF